MRKLFSTIIAATVLVGVQNTAMQSSDAAPRVDGLVAKQIGKLSSEAGEVLFVHGTFEKRAKRNKKLSKKERARIKARKRAKERARKRAARVRPLPRRPYAVDCSQGAYDCNGFKNER